MLMTSSLSQSRPFRHAISRRVISILLPFWCTSISPGSPGPSAFAAWSPQCQHCSLYVSHIYPKAPYSSHVNIKRCCAAATLPHVTHTKGSPCSLQPPSSTCRTALLRSTSGQKHAQQQLGDNVSTTIPCATF